MTRFARAKGSKASNERREEEATPWHVMRQQLAEQLRNHQTQSESEVEPYNLKDILSKGAKTQKGEVWSDFGEAKSNLQSQFKLNAKSINNEHHKIKKIKTNNKEEDVEETFSRQDRVETNIYSNKKQGGVSEENSSKDKKQKQKINVHKNKKLKRKDLTDENLKTSTECGVANKFVDGGKTISLNLKTSLKRTNKDESQNNVTKKIKRNKMFHGKNVFIESPIEPKQDSVELYDVSEKSAVAHENVKSTKNCKNQLTLKKNKKKLIKKNTTDVKHNAKHLDNLQEPNGNRTACLSNEKQSSENNKTGTFNLNKQKNSNLSVNDNKPYRNSENQNFSKNRFRKNHFPKYPHESSFQTIIANGREIHVVKYQGFLVKKEDAEELKKLRKKLLAQNIPKEKLETIMKLERRKAEKALAREKKKVCYHCRQFGHNFSDCPEIKDSDMVKTGVCFKCGSLEHSHYECKVLQHQEFRHAVCFVCREQGHIARQCPLNSQGLYPKGGSCHLCGEVTHLRKDCPKAVEEKTTKSVTVETMNDGTVEDIVGLPLKQRKIGINKKKVIKFK